MIPSSGLDRPQPHSTRRVWLSLEALIIGRRPDAGQIAEAIAAEAVHLEEAAAGEQPSGAAQPENATASQAGEAASTDPVEGA